jgi:hypothetical protein
MMKDIETTIELSNEELLNFEGGQPYLGKLGEFLHNIFCSTHGSFDTYVANYKQSSGSAGVSSAYH